LHFLTRAAYDSSVFFQEETVRNVAIIYKRSRPEAAKLAGELTTWLEQKGILVFCRQNIGDSSGVCGTYPRIDIPESVDLVVVLGGDGTFLSVARFLEERATPIVGVNLGGLGFLTEISAETCFKELGEIVSGRFEVEERMRLQVTIRRGIVQIFSQTVLNDVVINKGALARIVDLKTTIDGQYLTHYRADGLIVATPTGSTAYNLSAGGPIIYPTARAIVLSPICSFTLSNRPIIFPSDVTVEVEMEESGVDVSLTCDGQVGCALRPFDLITISVAPVPLHLIKTRSIAYLEILRAKLKWGQY
jgi:NAD+ kinase